MVPVATQPTCFRRWLLRQVNQILEHCFLLAEQISLNRELGLQSAMEPTCKGDLIQSWIRQQRTCPLEVPVDEEGG